ncbi:MAG: flagellar hook assembly protein FlgD [Verrucomicrobia bacterium]|nr:MAG: flagellar hook assembly protein FlgD [Verrucomicrobiota bacterium]
MNITPTSATSALAQSLPGSERMPKQSLGQDDYLRLLSVQFATQDPLNPVDDTSFIAEMANFTSLETSAKLAAEFERFADQSLISSANALLGRVVTVDPAEGEPVSGVVSAVRTTDEGPLLTVNGGEYAVSDVRRVELSGNSTTETSTQP